MPTAPAMDTSFDPAGTEPSTQPRPYSRPADVVATELGTDVSCGLSRQVAADRLAANGPNELPSKPPTPAWLRFLGQFNDPLVYLLLAAIVISTIAWVLEGAEGVPVDSTSSSSPSSPSTPSSDSSRRTRPLTPSPPCPP